MKKLTEGDWRVDVGGLVVTVVLIGVLLGTCG